MEAVVRSEVMDALVGFMCKNEASQEIIEIGLIPTEAELAEFPALRLVVTEDAPPKYFLRNVAVPAE